MKAAAYESHFPNLSHIECRGQVNLTSACCWAQIWTQRRYCGILWGVAVVSQPSGDRERGLVALSILEFWLQSSWQKWHRLVPKFKTSYPVRKHSLCLVPCPRQSRHLNLSRIKCGEGFLSSLDVNRKLILQHKAGVPGAHSSLR